MPSRLHSRFVVVPALLLSLASAQCLAASGNAELSTQLEAGKNVKVIDMGATGLEDLSNAVKRLNAPRESAPQAAPSAEPTPPVTEEALGPAQTETGADTSLVASTAGEHPSWLTGRWTLEAACPQPGTKAARMIEIKPTQAQFDQQACDIQAISAPKPEVAVVIYRCLLNAKSTQESHIFQKQAADKILMDNIAELTRCPPANK